MQDDATARVHQLARFGRVRFTRHAETRCLERGIARDAIVAALGHAWCRPDAAQPDVLLRWCELGKRLARLVLRIRDEPVGEVLVITVMWEDEDG